jgi:hypothetical protein
MIAAIETLLDDTYDSYATPEECEIFTKCIERFIFLLENIFILGSLKFFSIFTMKFSRNNFFY